MSTMSGPDRLDGCCKSALLLNKPKPGELAQKQYKTERGSSSSLHVTFHKYPQPRPGKLPLGSFFIKWLRFSPIFCSFMILFLWHATHTNLLRGCQQQKDAALLC